MYTQIFKLYKYNTYHQILTQSDKISLSLLLRLNSPSRQPVLVCEMLQSLYHLQDLSLDSLQYVCISLVLENPFQIQSHWC